MPATANPRAAATASQIQATATTTNFWHHPLHPPRPKDMLPSARRSRATSVLMASSLGPSLGTPHSTGTGRTGCVALPTTTGMRKKWT